MIKYILILNLLLFAGCNSIGLRDRMNRMESDIKTVKSAVIMHNIQIIDGAEVIQDISDDPIVDREAEGIKKHAEASTEAVSQLDDVVEDIAKGKADAKDMEQDMEDAESGQYSKIINLSVACIALAGLGFAAFLIWQIRAGLFVGVASLITYAISSFFLEYSKQMSIIVFVCVVLGLLYTGYQMWCGKKISFDLIHSFDFVKKKVDLSNDDKETIRRKQSVATEKLVSNVMRKKKRNDLRKD